MVVEGGEEGRERKEGKDGVSHLSLSLRPHSPCLRCHSIQLGFLTATLLLALCPCHRPCQGTGTIHSLPFLSPSTPPSFPSYLPPFLPSSFSPSFSFSHSSAPQAMPGSRMPMPMMPAQPSAVMGSPQLSLPSQAPPTTSSAPPALLPSPFPPSQPTVGTL